MNRTYNENQDNRHGQTRNIMQFTMIDVDQQNLLLHDRYLKIFQPF